MLVITGIFEDERFIPDEPVVIPQNKKVVVTIEEEPKTVSNVQNTRKKKIHSIGINMSGYHFNREEANVRR
jgi:S-adenosylmethionine synthetase